MMNKVNPPFASCAAPSKKGASTHACEEETVYVFQGGGALGAYQVGIIRGLREKNYSPHWVVGTSIGAINASIIAGNPYEKRLHQLEKFWETILWKFPQWPDALADNEFIRRYQNYWSAQLTLCFGLRGFFSPSLANQFFSANKPPSELGFYDVHALRETLKSLIDFDYLNSGEVRLSLGAVDIQSGEIVYFDSQKQKITLEHIMASAALPPAFPAVEIEGRFYWDGGLYTNTPIDYVLENKTCHDTLCFIIQLMGPDNNVPKDMDQVEKRKKEISFGSRYKEHLHTRKKIQGLKHVIHHLSEKLPPEIRKQPEIAALLAHGETHTLDVVHFHAPNLTTQLSSKDYEFSEKSAHELIAIAYQDALRAIANSPWREPMPKAIGIRLHEIEKR